MRLDWKRLIPAKSTIIKFLIFVFFFGVLSTYITSLVNEQTRKPPDNPLVEETEAYSNMPLLGNYVDFKDPEDQDSGKTDSEDEQQHDKEDQKQKSEDETQESKDKVQGSKDDNEHQEKETPETRDNKKEGPSGDKEHNKAESNGKNATSQKKKDSPHTEIIDPVGDQEDIEQTNSYFTTNIEEGEIVTEDNYAFQITQLDHHYTVDDVRVHLDSKSGTVKDITNDFDQPVQVQTDLAEGKNKIRIKVDYKNKSDAFTVLKTYTVFFDKDPIVIETDLSNETVKNDEMVFSATAKLSGKSIPLKVQLNNRTDKKMLEAASDNEYTANLAEGENEITLSAEQNDKRAEETFTVNYVKPESADITIKTDLKDYHEKTVKEQQLNFMAEAQEGESSVPLDVSHNGQSIENSDTNYQANLVEGENTFRLEAEKDGASESVSYTVYYAPKATGGEEEEPNENAPEITVLDIKDGESINNSIRTFQIKVKDYKGNSITETGKINAKNNGEDIPRDWTDSRQISFTLSIHDGTNNIVINAEDPYGHKTTKEITIEGSVNEEGDPIGTATISMEATTVGLGYLIQPQEVKIYQGEHSSQVLDRVLKDAGFDYINEGSMDSNFYMSAVLKPGLAENVEIPTDLSKTIEDHGMSIDESNYHPDVLGEFDFTGDSGWMFSVNGEYSNVGFADYYLKDGDELRIRYTLALGNDIGLGKNNFDKEW